MLVAALVFWLRKRMVAQGSRLEEAIAESLSQAAPSATGNQVTMVPVNAQHHASPPHHQYTDMNHTPYGPPHSVVPTAPMPPTLAPQPHQQQHAAPVPVFHAPTAYMPPSSSGGGDWLCGMCEHRNAAHCRSCDSCDAPKAKALAAAHALPPAMHAPQHAQPTYDHPATFEPGQGYGAQPFQMPHYSDAAPPPRYSVGAPPPDFQTPASAPPPPAYQF